MIDWSQVQTAEQREAKSKSDEAKAYLMRTDWYWRRELESGIPMPAEVKSLRVSAWADVVDWD